MDGHPKSPALPPWRWFCSDDVPERERLEVLNAEFGNTAFPCEVMPTGDDRLYMAGHAIALPGLFITHGVNRGVMYRRTACHIASDDLFMLTVTLDGRYHVHQHDSEFLVRPGQGWAVVSDTMAVASNVRGHPRESLSLMLPRAAFAHAKVDMSQILREPIACDNQAMQLLLAYVRGIESAASPLSPALGRSVVEHVCDLVLLAVHAAGDAADLARERGLPAARLRRLKLDIVHGIEAGQPLHLPLLAARHDISSVYVQKLFERDGTSFSAFVLEQRLERVHRMLRNPRFAARNISGMVYDAGFNNLSWFNRAFRRRYGATPSEVRAGR